MYNKVKKINLVVHLDSLPSPDDEELNVQLKEVVSQLKDYKVHVWYTDLEKLEEKDIKNIS